VAEQRRDDDAEPKGRDAQRNVRALAQGRKQRLVAPARGEIRRLTPPCHQIPRQEDHADDRAQPVAVEMLPRAPAYEPPRPYQFEQHQHEPGKRMRPEAAQELLGRVSQPQGLVEVDDDGRPDGRRLQRTPHRLDRVVGIPGPQRRVRVPSRVVRRTHRSGRIAHD
jgi:hypothetical protein